MSGTSLEKLIREALEKKDCTLSDVAKDLNVSRVTMYNLFKGQYSRKLLQKVSSLTSIPIHVLMCSNPSITQSMDDQLLTNYHASSPETQIVVNRILGVDSEQSFNSGKKRPQIIVVDDLIDNVELLERTLRKDFDVMGFTNPVLALEAARKARVDAVITDQRMPQMNGTKLLEQIHGMDKSIMKIIVSAYTDKDGFMEAINHARADAFFTKPFKPAEIREAIQKNTNTRKSRL